jgi:hypothetical protein
VTTAAPDAIPLGKKVTVATFMVREVTPYGDVLADRYLSVINAAVARLFRR